MQSQSARTWSRKALQSCIRFAGHLEEFPPLSSRTYQWVQSSLPSEFAGGRLSAKSWSQGDGLCSTRILRFVCDEIGVFSRQLVCFSLLLQHQEVAIGSLYFCSCSHFAETQSSARTRRNLVLQRARYRMVKSPKCLNSVGCWVSGRTWVAASPCGTWSPCFWAPESAAGPGTLTV